MKDIKLVLIEAIIVGLFLVVLYFIIDKVLPKQNMYIKLFVSGLLFHIIFEYTGLNVYYVKEYSKLISKSS